MKIKILIISSAILLCVGLLSSAHAADPGRFINVSTSGEVFLNYMFNVSGVENDGETKYPNEFSVDRVYINFKSSLSDQVAMRFTTDVDPGVVDGKGYGIRVKYAYADFSNIIPMTKITFGLQGNLWTGMADNAWGYRVVSKSLFDQYKVLASADLGIGAAVSIPEGYGEIVLQVLNGGGYKELETNTGKALAARVLLNPMPKDDLLKGLGVAGFVYVDKDDDDNSKTRFGGMLKYSYQIVNLVGEFGISQDGADEVKGMGFSVATEVKSPVTEGPMKNLALIGRMDTWDKDTDKDDNEVLQIIGGVSYEITKGVKAIATLQHVDDKGKDESEQQIVAQAYIKF
jgi:hypothetical protein